MNTRKDANLRRLAIMALNKKGLSISELSIEEIQALKLPTVITTTLVGIKNDVPTLTVEQAKADCDIIRSAASNAPVVDHSSYDPKHEMKELTNQYVEPTEVIFDEPTITLIQENVAEVIPYSEEELRLVFEKLTSKNANTLLKLALADIDASAVDQVLVVKLSKEYAAINKAAK